MKIVDFLKKVVGKAEPAPLFTTIIDQAYAELQRKHGNFMYLGLKPSESEVFALQVVPLSDQEKIGFITGAVAFMHNYYQTRKDEYNEEQHRKLQLADEFMRHLLKTKLATSDDDLCTIGRAFLAHRRYEASNVLVWPIGSFLGLVEKAAGKRPLSEKVYTLLSELKAAIEHADNSYYEKDQAKLAGRIDELFFRAANGTDAIKPVYFPGTEDFAAYANEQLRNTQEPQRAGWFRLLDLSRKASGGTPSAKYLKEAEDLVNALGRDVFEQGATDWARFVAVLKDKSVEHTHDYGNGQTYSYTSWQFLAGPNADMLKGIVWMGVHTPGKALLASLAALAERCYRKVPGAGPVAPALGNACIYTLAKAKGLEGVAHLSRLRLRIRQTNTQKLIEKYLLAAAAEQGVSVHDIEDLAVDHYGLHEGARTYELEGYKAVLQVTGIGKTGLHWYKPDGSPQKSVPAAVKTAHAATLKEIKETVKGIETTLTIQRDRLDRLFRSERTLGWPAFTETYFHHGLLSFITRRLIWTFERAGVKESAIYAAGQWVRPAGVLSFTPDEATTVSLWHPAWHGVDEVRAWRDFLLDQQIVQPLKQAFREVYLLTDAELATRTYSNRMAAHLLKQHQFNSLAKTRGWKYSLLGAYDDGRYNEAASLLLPDRQLQAEFWVNEVAADNAFNDTGIWNYVATDQVRFIDLSTGRVMELIDVPRILFSEVMRDVDLFVGVASVGNDPAWQDSGGLPAYRDYWQAYSFGDLSEVAKTRKALLERLVPRLKFAHAAEIRDKFLVIQGKLRTYKIHLGSTNILMEPNDQYLCIVPDRSQKDTTANVFLPFEGDSGISVILSKAFLLYDDDKITDPTITRQINSR